MVDSADEESRALLATIAALSSVSSLESRRRIVAYIVDRFARADALAPNDAAPRALHPSSASELSGVAILRDGELKITARDLKARSQLDAAVRLAHVAIYASEVLAQRPLSSRKGLTPILKAWRVYDGNARARLAREKGIVRNGDDLTLDEPARHAAERFVAEIRDENLKGEWKAL